MTHRERFHRVFTYQPVDRIPFYFFGAWPETKRRWIAEGFTGECDLSADKGPQLPGMDPDWEVGLWDNHGMVVTGPIGDIEPIVLEEYDDKRVVRSATGKVDLIYTGGTSISHTITHPLEPTRASWDHFKRWLDVDDPRRVPDDRPQIAQRLNARDAVTCFMGGSFYGWLRDFMGVVNLSYLMYDDPVLLEEMVETLAEHFMRLLEPVLKICRFDFVYFFEDCCGASGPLFSPKVYRAVFDRYYQKLIRFYKSMGVPLALIDSDGVVDPLVSCWLGSGFDIVFPVEVGVWGANPAQFREKFGSDLRMFGGVDKRLISGPEEALRRHLFQCKKEADKGGYIPIPDHRIPPEVSYEQMKTYVRVFREVFGID